MALCVCVWFVCLFVCLFHFVVVVVFVCLFVVVCFLGGLVLFLLVLFWLVGWFWFGLCFVEVKKKKVFAIKKEKLRTFTVL